MTEPTIICPNCKTEIKLTESLAAPLIEAIRKQYEQQLTQKDTDIAKREQAMREKEKQLATAKTTLDQQVANQVEEQLKKDRARIAADEAKKAKQAAATDLEQKARELSDEVGSERSLLVLCPAFRGKGEYPNLTVKKIPKQVLSRCEWGHDDYSLRVENLPQKPPEPGQQAFDLE